MFLVASPVNDPLFVKRGYSLFEAVVTKTYNQDDSADTTTTRNTTAHKGGRM
eukprot:m.343949 g.343949  ORF g.343949 m.343949 type:complete len:52 (+) comp23601_c0_seq1:332-487(+)